jgi:hypothetical protein
MVARLVDFLHGIRQFLDVVEEDSELFEGIRTMARPYYPSVHILKHNDGSPSIHPQLGHSL